MASSPAQDAGKEPEPLAASHQDTAGEGGGADPAAEHTGGREDRTTATVEGGQVVISGPGAGGEPAVLLPGPHLLLVVNGQVQKGPVKVTASDRVEARPEVVDPVSEVQARVSGDQLEAYLRLELKDGVRYALRDSPPTPRLALATEPAEVLKAAVRREDVDRRLAELGLVAGIREEAIERALANPGEEVLLARGEPPLPGEDGHIVWLKEEPSRGELLEGAGLVGFRPVVSAEAGEVLAVKVPPRPGQPGRSIYGKELPPPPVRDVYLKAGVGAELQEDRVVASVAGRPELRGNIVFVYQSLAVQGDVEAKGGYIRFNGDVLVQGNLLDGMRVEARGRIEVEGYAAYSTLNAGGDIVVRRNLINCQVRAGGSGSQYYQVADGLRHLRETCQEFLAALDQLQGNESFRHLSLEGQRVILQNLLDGRFSYLKKELQTGAGTMAVWRDELAGDPLIPDEDWVKLAEAVRQVITLLNASHQPEVFRVEVFQAVFRKIEGSCLEMEAVLEGAVSKRSEVVAAYLQNSRVWASGGVRVTGRGSYGSTLVAGGPVKFSGSPGACIGGSLSARGDVEARELGAPGETPTLVEVPRGCRIRAQKVHPGVTLKAGARVEKVLLTSHNINFAED